MCGITRRDARVPVPRRFAAAFINKKFKFMEIITCPSADMICDVVRIIFEHLSEAEFAIRKKLIFDLVESNAIQPDGIFVALDDGVVVGGLISQFRPDGFVMIWHPAMSGNYSMAPFFERLDIYAKSLNAPAIILMTDNNQPVNEPVIMSCGFLYLSDMLMLAAKSGDVTDSKNTANIDVPPKNIITKFEQYAIDKSYDLAVRRDEFERLMKLTYKNTADFPRLNMITPVESILDEYQQQNLFCPDLWFFIRGKITKETVDQKTDDAYIGVLLLSDAGAEQMELTYMGLVEQYRGFGLADEIIKFAKLTSAKRGRNFITTAVDEQNSPALRAYIKQGFAAWDRKKVYAKFL
ncbi:MAG: GNAT family N-acetyltransferase [Planctomycetaceae bacterium]|jgi:GNAT superfamily N-acetyltransferase|nr:GNAT family N-acetyltransferase [Planctomycetaceae bacterium]